MIREHFILVIICFLSSLLSDRQMAIASVPKDFTPITFEPSLDNRIKVSRSEQLDYTLLLGQNTSNQSEPQLEDGDLTVDAPRQIDRDLTLAAMAVMSVVSLFLLWILFKKPQPATESLGADRDNDLEPAIGEEETELLQLDVRETENNTDGVDATINTEEDFASAGINWLVEQHRATMENEKTSQPIPTDLASADIDVVAELIRDLQHSDRQLRRKAIWELAERGDPRSIQPLSDLMPDVSSLDKSLISNAITQIVHRSFQPINHRLFANLQHQDPQIKKNAINDLSVLYSFIAPVTQKLVQMQLDKDPEVSQTAIRALRRLNISSYFEPDKNHRDRHSTAARKAKANLHLVTDLPTELDAEP